MKTRDGFIGMTAEGSYVHYSTGGHTGTRVSLGTTKDIQGATFIVNHRRVPKEVSAKVTAWLPVTERTVIEVRAVEEVAADG